MRFSAILVGLCLAGCSTTNPFADVSPLETDPAGLRAAVDLPPGLAVPPGGATLRLQATRADLGEATGGSFPLVATPQGTRDIYRVDEDDLDAVRELQTRIRTWQAIAPDATSGSLSVTMAACREGSGPSDDAVMTVWLSPAVGVPLTPLAVDVPVAEAMAHADSIGACD